MNTTQDNHFWAKLDELVAACTLRIDRPQGARHPRYPDWVYPLDYGYLEGTRSADGGGIDVWVGSLAEKRATAIICTVDMVKRDSEVKILLGCTAQETQEILDFHNDGLQVGILMERPV